jgi:hypothetical protein
VARAKRKAISQHIINVWSSRRMSVLIGWLGVVTLAVCFGLLASRGYAVFLIVAFLLWGLVVWAVPRPVIVPVVMLGVVVVPTAAFPNATAHGIPLQTSLAVITFCAALALWLQRRARGGTAPLSGYSLAGLLILIVASIVQLGTSRYAQIRPVYQFPLFWTSGFLLGSILAADLRVADRIGLLALPLAMLAIFESAVGKPNLWSDLIGANSFANASAEGAARAASTFGHPLVAGTALIVLAFLVLSKPGPRRSILFSFIVGGAVVTVSRSALVGLAAGLLTHFIGNHRKRSQIVGAIAVTAIIGWLIISLVPALHVSFESRVLHASTQSESIRLNSLQELRASFSRSDKELWLGRGLEGSGSYLSQTRGNLGFGTYDNQYVTSLYDSGLLVVLAAIGLIVLGTIRARPSARVLAPLVASAATFFFFEGLYWPVTGLLFWMTVSLATASVDSRSRRD